MIKQCQLASVVFALALSAGLSMPARAGNLDIADSPLFAAVAIEPNLMFTLDDSGSMQWEHMPDGGGMGFSTYMFPRPSSLYGGADYTNQVPRFDDDNNLHNFYGRSAANNAVFYNPDITYTPWANADGTSMGNADPSCAYYNPDRTDRGCLDLTQQDSKNALWFWNTTNDNLNQAWGGWATRSYWPITYFNYLGGTRTNRTSYQLVQITSSTSPGATFTSPGGITRTRDEEIQNFANWFQYYRSRLLAARAGIGLAFVELPDNARVGFGAINQGSSNVDSVNTSTIIDGVRSFDTAQRSTFYDRLYSHVVNTSGTPLRRAANDVGQYFSRTDSQGPWSTTPGSGGGDNLSCRQSYHILMTDGFWNGPNPSVGNADNANGPVHTDVDGNTDQYVAIDPFRDAHSNTLGDVAMAYWKADLRTDLDNRVPTNEVDGAFWQHLTTYGIGLGVQGTLDPTTVFGAVETEAAMAWPDPTATNPAKIDDLLHFGLNGRGGFFSAADPDTFARELGDILADIAERSGATTGLSASSTRLNQGSVIYAAEFDSEDWIGNLRALDAIDGSELASAADELTTLGYASRSIFTYDPDSELGVVFENAGEVADRVLDDAPAAWDADQLFAYLKGNLAAGGGTFRSRTHMLGDIVNAQPFFSGPGNLGWSVLDSGYLDYIDCEKQDPRDTPAETGCTPARSNTVFVGANDGMLHAFDAVTLVEHFAYVPSAVHDHLWELADPSYTHRFYVDGQVTVGDAKFGSNWRTVLVGGLGAGGRGIYALDVTTPQSFSSSDVLWDFTAEDDADLGFTYGKPAIARLESGRWVAIFGNGFNSQNNQAFLYVVDLQQGPDEFLLKIPVGAAGSNGLGGVAALRDLSSRVHVSRVYVGDLLGNVWRVDFSGAGASVAFSGQPLFTDPNARPIVAAPDVAPHPVEGFLIYFGSGKLIENADRLVSTNLERFYALRDRNSTIASLASLDPVTLSAGPTSDLRIATASGGTANGWYVDLQVGSPSGERVLFPPRVFAGRVLFNTFEPANDPCQPGGLARVYVLSAFTGSGALGGPSGGGCTGCGGLTIGSGAAVAPVFAIKKNPATSVGSDLGNPGLEDPCLDDCDGGGDGEDPSNPPPGASGVRNDWCDSFGQVLPGGNFMAFGTFCEGRQVWRQVR